MTTVGPLHKRAIRAGWVVVFDGVRQTLLANGVVVWQGDTISYVGRDVPDDVDVVEEAPGKLLIPGLISTHAHVGIHAGDRLVVDQGRRDLLFTGYLNYSTRRKPDSPGLGSYEDPAASARFGFGTLLRSGVTTVLDMGSGGFAHGHTVVEAAIEAGIRLYYGPALAVADYLYGDDDAVVRKFQAGAERRLLDQAESFALAHEGAGDGRIRTAVVVDELFTSTAELLVGAKDLADRLSAPLTLHIAEQVFEFHETLRTTGLTPIGYVDDLGILDHNVVLGHAVYVSGHSLTAYPYRGDLEAIGRSGASVAHAPLAWARRGVVLEDFRRYQEHGILMSIGTDSYPQDILLEMQMASVLGKVATRDHEAATAAEIFTAATLGGARALGRDDLGRISPGAKADLVLVDLIHPRIGPIFDPIRSLLHSATSDQVEDVIVGGQYVVHKGRVQFAEESDLILGASYSAMTAWKNFGEVDQNRRSADVVFPRSFADF
ncbi:amidohydrolase family protein [Mesorhizobium loti]|nr:amidohydrolase family protein [Mesorhizobium loti]